MEVRNIEVYSVVALKFVYLQNTSRWRGVGDGNRCKEANLGN